MPHIMKFSLLILPVIATFLCSCTGRSITQPIAQEGKAWHIKTQIPYYDDRYTHDVHMWIEGDTLVDGLACKRLSADLQQNALILDLTQVYHSSLFFPILI